jgi:hypothetical protein
VGHRVERARVEAVGEGVVDEEARDLEQPRLARVREAKALERSQVVGVAELRAQLFEELPVALLALLAERGREVRAKVGRDRVVVEQRVVDVEEKDGARQAAAPSLDFDTTIS